MVGKKGKNGCLVVFVVTAIILIALIFAGLGYYTYLKSAVTLENDVTVTIPDGASTGLISDILQEAGVVRSSLLFTFYAKSEGIENSLKPGEYLFAAGKKLGFSDIADPLCKGIQAKGTKVVLPEGFTVAQIATRFAKKGLIDPDIFLAYIANGDFPYEYLPPVGTTNRLEGFLFPATYEIMPDWTEEDIVDLLLAQFDKNWTKEWQQQAEKMGYSVSEILTIASMIERETSVDKERPMVASVIYNRLEKGMRLQIDATIQYLLGEQKEHVLYSDLEIDSPYNTYKNNGLPPGPIACPGAACIQAALYPDQTDYLYYRAKGDGSQEHYFAVTYEEHLANGKK